MVEMEPAGAHKHVQGSAARRRKRAAVIAMLGVLAAIGVVVHRGLGADGPPLTPLQARIVRIAESQLGYRTNPDDSYCNRFSAYWGAGTADCPPGNLDEQWCADFAAWVWRQAGASVVYGYSGDELNGASFSFYRWGVAHHTWHRATPGYAAAPGDVALYGLDVPAGTAAHVAVVVGWPSGQRGPDVVNGDGDRSGFSVVELGTDQFKADVSGPGGRLSGFVTPSVTSWRAPRR